MPESRSTCPLGHRALFAWLLLSCGAATVRTQPPPLAPTVDTVISVSATTILHYSSIHIPAGVTVRFIASGGAGRPAVIMCDGQAIVHGTMSVTDEPFANNNPAGWVTAGYGADGRSCGILNFASPGWPPQGGRHAGHHGSVLPFSLEGGSPGGFTDNYANSNCSGTPTSYSSGGMGGGTLVLIAGDRIEIYGTVIADGAGGRAGGSGGSILLRGHGGVYTDVGASITARGSAGLPTWVMIPPNYTHAYTYGADGYIRIDAWGVKPTIQGQIEPAPTVLELPYLHAPSQPAIGSTWSFDVYAPETAWVYAAASLGPSPGTPTPYGPLGLDLATAVGIAQAIPQPGHDPVANMQWPVPNVPAAIGMQLWVQAIAVPSNLPGRLTNTLAVVIQ